MELEQRDTEKINGVLPELEDKVQKYIAGLRLDDLKGSAGLNRLREQLLLHVNSITAPIIVKDVLFKEILIQ